MLLCEVLVQTNKTNKSNIGVPDYEKIEKTGEENQNTTTVIDIS